MLAEDESDEQLAVVADTPADDNEQQTLNYSDPENETEPSARERDADRALRGAILGIIMLPVQLYVFCLLIKVFISDQPLHPAWRRKFVIAAIINIPSVLACGWFVASWLGMIHRY